MTLQNLNYKQFCDVASTEAQRIIEQTQLDAAKNSTERNRLGQFATPNTLAIEIINYSKTLLPPDRKIRFLDPAIGTGSFYSALLQSFSIDRIESAVGYEIDRDFAETAIKLWANTPLQLNIADFTESIAPQNEKHRANLLICNPPYVRHHHLSIDRKKSLKQIGIAATGTQLSGLAGLYCYFLLAAHQWMSPDGLACWVIPAEFMDVNYGKDIKKYLLDRVTLIRVHRFDADDLRFDNVLVSTSIIWFRNTPPVGDYSVEFTYGRSMNKPISSHSVSTKTLRKISKWNRYSTLSDRLTRTESEPKLSDLFQIKRGVATGANNFFILTSEQIDRFNIPSELLTPILPSPRYLIDTEILADDLGNPQIDRRLFLLTCKQQPEELSINYPDVWNYLKQGVDAGISARYLCSHRALWYVQENRDPAIFLCPYMGRNQSKDSKPFRFIFNHSKAIAPNVYLMMYPKEYLATLFATNPELSKYIWQALNSIPSQSLINEGRVYGDGLHKLEPRELANAPADRLLKIIENYNQPTLV